MANRRSCSYRGCVPDEGVSLFTFPKNLERATLWIRACNREDLLSKPLESLHRDYKLCEKHFEAKYLSKTTNSRKRLIGEAIPTIFPHYRRCVHEDIGTPSHFPRKSKELRAIENIIQLDVTGMPTTSAYVSGTPMSNHPEVAEEESRTVENTPMFDVTEMPSTSYSFPVKITDGTDSDKSPTSVIPTQTPPALSSHTPRKEKLRKQIKELQRCKRTLFSKEPEIKSTVQQFLEMCDHFLPSTCAEIIKEQALLKDKAPHARRYSSRFKQFALTIYFLGPRVYQYLQKTSILYLPSKRSLERMTENLVCHVGLHNEAIFNALTVKLKIMREQDKHCILCIDEMSLKANLFFHTGRDEIIGLHDTGVGKKELVAAQNATVIMVRGLYSNWKQPIAYFFVASQFPSVELCQVIKECIIQLTNIGLSVDAVVSDMGSNFIQVSNMLGVTPERPLFTVNDKNVIYLFDTCHLLKATRNNLQKNSFIFEGKTTSWKFIEAFYEHDKKERFRCATKLTDSHIYPTNFEKMKVKLAAQVFSNTVVSGMNVYLSVGRLPAEAMATIEVLEKMDKLFDILNSYEKNHPNKYKNIFQATDYQITHLNDMLSFFNNLVIVDNNGENVTSKSKFRKCWIITLNGIKLLWSVTSSCGFDYLKLRKVNQDCLENFFGNIRQQGGNCINPTPIQFERAFKKLFCQSYLHSGGMNCIDDEEHLLTTLSSTDIPHIFEDNIETKALILPDYDYRNEDITVQNPFTYVCGYLIKKALTVHSCDICEKFSKESQELDASRLLIHFKAFSTEESIYGSLRSPPEHFINFVYKLEQLFLHYSDDVFTKNKTSNTYFTHMRDINFEHPCEHFPLEYVIKLFIRLRIFHTIKYANREIKENKKQKINRKLTILSHI